MGALFGSFLGFLETVGIPFEREDLGVVDEAVDQGDDAGGVREDLVPFAK